MKFFRLAHMVLAGIIFLAPAALAQEDVLPSDMFTAVMLKALNYDRNIDRHAHEKVDIGIVYAEGDTASHIFSDDVHKNISRVQATFRLKDKPVEGHLLGVDRLLNRKQFELWLRANNISVLVVATTDLALSREIFEVTGSLGINSVCYSAACVNQGAALGIVRQDNKPRMLINRDVTTREGSDYGGKFLALCDVIP